ncbi:unnamed protein product [Amoebophrya sp. A25]|nr:unnamed protein product [Amoebophrya sp. A25]|eukprot:GSA25T00015723001.1
MAPTPSARSGADEDDTFADDLKKLTSVRERIMAQNVQAAANCNGDDLKSMDLLPGFTSTEPRATPCRPPLPKASFFGPVSGRSRRTSLTGASSNAASSSAASLHEMKQPPPGTGTASSGSMSSRRGTYESRFKASRLGGNNHVQAVSGSGGRTPDQSEGESDILDDFGFERVDAEGLTAQDRQDLAELRDIARGNGPLPMPAFYAIDPDCANYRKAVSLEEVLEVRQKLAHPETEVNGEETMSQQLQLGRLLMSLNRTEEAYLRQMLPVEAFEGRRVGGRKLPPECAKELRVERLSRCGSSASCSRSISKDNATSISEDEAVPGGPEDASPAVPFFERRNSPLQHGLPNSGLPYHTSQNINECDGAVYSKSKPKHGARTKEVLVKLLRSWPLRHRKGLRALLKAFRKVDQNPGNEFYRRLRVSKLLAVVFEDEAIQPESRQLLSQFLRNLGWELVTTAGKVSDHDHQKPGGNTRPSTAGDSDGKQLQDQRFILELSDGKGGGGCDSSSSMLSLHLAIRYMEVLLDGHHDPSTLCSARTGTLTSCSSKNENQTRSARVAALREEVERALLVSSGQKSTEKCTSGQKRGSSYANAGSSFSPLCRAMAASSSSLVESGLPHNVCQLVHSWAIGNPKSSTQASSLTTNAYHIATTLALGESCGNLQPDPKTELRSLLRESREQLATTNSRSISATAGAGLSPTSAARAAAAAAVAWNAWFTDRLCALASSTDQSNALRVRWELLRVAIFNAPEPTNIRGKLIGLLQKLATCKLSNIKTAEEEKLMQAKFREVMRRQENASLCKNTGARASEGSTGDASLLDSANALLERLSKTVDCGMMHAEETFGSESKTSDGDGNEQRDQEQVNDSRDDDTTLSSALRLLGLSALPQSFADLRKAYRERCLQCHPDKAGGSKEAFQRMHQAFLCLREQLTPAMHVSFSTEDTTTADEKNQDRSSKPAQRSTGDNSSGRDAGNDKHEEREPSKLQKHAEFVSGLISTVVSAIDLKLALRVVSLVVEAATEFCTLLREESDSALQESFRLEHAFFSRECGFEAVAAYRAADIVDGMRLQVTATAEEAQKFLRATTQKHAEAELLEREIYSLLAGSVVRLQNCITHAAERCERATSMLDQVRRLSSSSNKDCSKGYSSSSDAKNASALPGPGKGMIRDPNPPSTDEEQAASTTASENEIAASTSATLRKSDEPPPQSSTSSEADVIRVVRLLQTYINQFSQAQWIRAEDIEFKQLQRAAGWSDDDLFSAFRRFIIEETKIAQQTPGSTNRRPQWLEYVFSRDRDTHEESASASQRCDLPGADVYHRRALLRYLLAKDHSRFVAVLASCGISADNDIEFSNF